MATTGDQWCYWQQLLTTSVACSFSHIQDFLIKTCLSVCLVVAFYLDYQREHNREKGEWHRATDYPNLHFVMKETEEMVFGKQGWFEEYLQLLLLNC